MIVTEKNVSDALAYLAADPHPLAIALHELTKAENATRETLAREFLAVGGGGVEARRALAEVTAAVIGARRAVAAATLEAERHKSRRAAATMIVDVWRTENANARSAERVR